MSWFKPQCEGEMNLAEHVRLLGRIRELEHSLSETTGQAIDRRFRIEKLEAQLAQILIKNAVLFGDFEKTASLNATRIIELTEANETLTWKLEETDRDRRDKCADVVRYAKLLQETRKDRDDLLVKIKNREDELDTTTTWLRGWLERAVKAESQLARQELAAVVARDGTSIEEDHGEWKARYEDLLAAFDERTPRADHEKLERDCELLRLTLNSVRKVLDQDRVTP